MHYSLSLLVVAWSSPSKRTRGCVEILHGVGIFGAEGARLLIAGRRGAGVRHQEALLSRLWQHFRTCKNIDIMRIKFVILSIFENLQNKEKYAFVGEIQIFSRAWFAAKAPFHKRYRHLLKDLGWNLGRKAPWTSDWTSEKGLSSMWSSSISGAGVNAIRGRTRSPFYVQTGDRRNLRRYPRNYQCFWLTRAAPLWWWLIPPPTGRWRIVGRTGGPNNRRTWHIRPHDKFPNSTLYKFQNIEVGSISGNRGTETKGCWRWCPPWIGKKW